MEVAIFQQMLMKIHRNLTEFYDIVSRSSNDIPYQVDLLDKIDEQIAHKALNALDVDRNGLDDMDIRMLRAIIEHYGGGPVGLSTLGVAVGEDKGTIEEVYEPFLIKEGFLKRTPKGRVATAKAFSYLGLKRPNDSEALFWVRIFFTLSVKMLVGVQIRLWLATPERYR